MYEHLVLQLLQSCFARDLHITSGQRGQPSRRLRTSRASHRAVAANKGTLRPSPRVCRDSKRRQPVLQDLLRQVPRTGKEQGRNHVHSLDGDLSAGQELDKWESVLEMLESGEMPPIDEPQPTKAETQAVKHWIESGMRDYVQKASAVKREAKTRRLTNVEYENTLSDLLGFEFDVIDDLPEDPEHHYHFNNTAELMRIGPEQLDRYLEIARKAMRARLWIPRSPRSSSAAVSGASAVFDNGTGQDEIGAFWESSAPSLASGSQVPLVTGEFRIRLSASALLLPGHDEVPLQLIMGMPRDGDHNEKAHRVIGTAYLTNSPDEPQGLRVQGSHREPSPSLNGSSRKPTPES